MIRRSLGILWFASLGTSYAQTALAQPLPLDQAKVIAYSKGFAKRFELPEPSTEMELAGGVQAVEFSLEMGPKFAPHYACILKVYLDSTLSIAYPATGIAGSRALVELPEHFVFYNKNNPDNQRWLTLGVEDRLHFSNQNHFRRQAALASPDLEWPVKGFWGELTYDSFYQELFPGITYVKFSSWCGIYSDGEKKETVQLWVKRVGGKDYKYVVKPDPVDFLKFNLPPAFLKAALKWAKPASEYNRVAIEELPERIRK